MRARRQNKGLPTTNHSLYLSLVLNILLVTTLWYIMTPASNVSSTLLQFGGSIRSTPIQWHGGHSSELHLGSCVCNDQPFCMCTPSLAIDLIIVYGSDHFLLVRRKDTNQLATMGGFVQVGETTEAAVVRELKEETGLELENAQPILTGIYSDPRRDSRRHTVSATYAVHLSGTQQPKAADDVKEVVPILMSDVEKYDMFCDHKTILLDYRRALREGNFVDSGQPHPSSNDFVNDISRSTCYYSSVTTFVDGAVA